MINAMSISMIYKDRGMVVSPRVGAKLSTWKSEASDADVPDAGVHLWEASYQPTKEEESPETPYRWFPRSGTMKNGRLVAVEVEEGRKRQKRWASNLRPDLDNESTKLLFRNIAVKPPPVNEERHPLHFADEGYFVPSKQFTHSESKSDPPPSSKSRAEDSDTSSDLFSETTKSGRQNDRGM